MKRTDEQFSKYLFVKSSYQHVDVFGIEIKIKSQNKVNKVKNSNFNLRIQKKIIRRF